MCVERDSVFETLCWNDLEEKPVNLTEGATWSRNKEVVDIGEVHSQLFNIMNLFHHKYQKVVDIAKLIPWSKTVNHFNYVVDMV